MAIFIVTFALMLLAIAGMAIGVLCGRTPIAGSCGGLNAVNGSSECQSCSRPCSSKRAAMAKGER
jgi:hypothetical protein